MECFVRQDGEGDCFFRFAVDAVVGGRAEKGRVECVAESTHELRILYAAAGSDHFVDAHFRGDESLQRRRDRLGSERVGGGHGVGGFK